MFNSDNGLPSNEIYAAYETQDGLLYVGHDLGLSIYDGNEFETVSVKGVKEGTSCYGIYKIKGKIWFKFVDQLYYKSGSNILPYKYNNVLSKENIGTIYHFNFINDELHFSSGYRGYKITLDGRLVNIDLGKHILKIDRQNKHIIRQTENGIDSLNGEYDGISFHTKTPKSQTPHFGIEFNHHDIYWTGSSWFYFINDSIQVVPIETYTNNNYNWIISLLQVDNKLYVSTKFSGILTYEKIGNKWVEKTKILPNAFVGILSKGKSGLWVPIVDKGLAFIPNEEINNYAFNKEVKTIYLDQDTIFVGTLDQVKNTPIWKISPNKKLQADTSFKWTVYNYEYIQHINSLNLNQIASNASTIKGIVQPIKNRYFYSSIHSNVFLNNSYFIQTTKYYVSLENVKNRFKDTIWIKGIQSAQEIDSKNYLLGGEFGLTKLKIRKDAVYQTKNDSTIRDILKIQKIKGSVYALTHADGVYLYDIEKLKVISNLYKNKSEQTKCSFLMDSLLFVGTTNYLELIDTNSGRRFYLSKSSGLSNSNISNIIGNESILAVSHEEGVSTIPMEFILKKLNTEKEDFNDYVDFETSNKSINLNFNYFDLNPWSKLSTQYSLNGDDYIDFSNQKLQLTSLQSGEYILKIRFRISSGNWIELEPIYFDIPSPFYAQWWFSASIVAFIALVIILIIRRRNQIQTKRLQTEKLIETLRMNALTSQMNPHFLYNALNTIQGLLTGDTKKVFMYVSDLARFFRLMLNNSSDIYIPIHKEIELNQIFAEIESVRQYHQVKLKINYESEQLQDFIIPSMILQPFVENALWHAFPKEIENPEVHIQIREFSNDAIKITIQDNGVGISNTKNKNKVHQSKGVSIVENRLKLFNTDNSNLSKTIILTDRSEEDSDQRGTKVELYLTKQNEHDLQSDDH